jgi:gliding motility-associated-like protein
MHPTLNTILRLFPLCACLIINAPDNKGQCPIEVNAGEDIYLCTPPTPTQLNGSISGPYLNFLWTPTTGLTGANTLTPAVNISQTTTYVLTGRSVNLNNNLIENGDFGGGNSGFYSDYQYSPGNLYPEGRYDILPNPQASHSSFAPCADHTGGGNMMAVNGAGTPNQQVWCQSVAVTPNTLYAFSAWVTTLVNSSLAILQFNINNIPIGPVFNAPPGLCNWVNYYTTWNSGANTSAEICIVNLNTATGGNDFALDDLVFSPICTETDTVTVHVVNIVATSQATVNIPCDGANITLNGTGSSTGPDITYLWETTGGNIVSGATTLNPVVNAPGVYTLTVTYQKNGYTCTKTTSVNVVLSPNPFVAWINPPSALGCGTPTVSLVGNSSQPGLTNWQWTTTNGNIVSGANQKICVVNQAGNYDLLATNVITGCTATATITVSNTTNPPVSIANTGNNLTCLLPSTPLLGNGSSTGNGITYTWTTPNGNITGPTNTLNTTAGSAGTYILAVTNTNNNCTSLDTTLVTANTTAPTISITPPGVLDCDTDTLQLNATPNPPNATPNWTTSNGGTIASGQNTNTPQITTAGLYTLTLTHPDNGCTSSASQTITADYSPPTAHIATPDSITCQDPSISLSGAGSSTGTPYTYSWTATNGGNIVQGDQTLQPTVNAAGTYTLAVTNSINACVQFDTTLVVADTNVVTAIANAPDTLRCNNTTVNLNNNGSSTGPAITLAWSTSNGIILGDTASTNPTAGAPGIYTLLITNTANGCTATDIATVYQDTTPPTLTILPTNLLTCANPVQTITGIQPQQGTFSYSWQAPNGASIISGENTTTPTVNTPGTYTVTITNTLNGCTASLQTNVNQEAGVPTALINPTTFLSCTQPQITLTTNGSSIGTNFQYLWTATNGGNIPTGANSPQPAINQPGTYNLLITNTQNGCTATNSITVSRDTTHPNFSINTPNPLTCFQPTQQLTANNYSINGNFLIEWTAATPNTPITYPNSLNPVVTTADQYTLRITNTDNGCSSEQTISVPEDFLEPNFTIAQTAPLSCTNTQQTILTTNQGADLPCSFLWTSSANLSVLDQPNIPVTEPGNYQLLITNTQNGCTQTISTWIAQDINPPTVSLSQPAQIRCDNPTTSIQGTTNATNATYLWTTTNGGTINTPTNSAQITAASAGTYHLLVTNADNGCTAATSVNVSQNTTNPTVDAGPADTLSCSVNSLIIQGQANGSGNLQFQWTASNGGNILSGGNTPTPTINKPGTYTASVTDTDNGCTATDTVTIFTDLSAPTASISPANTLTCTSPQIALTGSGSAGNAISYLWSSANGGNITSGITTLQPFVNAPGTYTLQVSNAANGCTATASVQVFINVTPPTISPGPTGTLTCTQTTLPINAGTTNTNLNFSWSGPGITGGQNTTQLYVNKPGNYTLLSTDPTNGCTATGQVTIQIDTTKPIVTIATPPILTCTTTEVALNGSANLPANQTSASWTTTNGNLTGGQNLPSATANKPGTYLLTITNTQNGCASSKNISVNQDIVGPTALVTTPPIITCTNPTVTISGQGSTTGNQIAYLWTTTQGGNIVGPVNTIDITAINSGLYTLLVTNLNNGCTQTQSVNVIKNQEPPAFIIANPGILTCTNTSVVLNSTVSQPSNGFSALWTSPAGNPIFNTNSLNPTVENPGTYQLQITNQQNGCTATSATTVTQNILKPGAEAGPPYALNCQDLFVWLNGSTPSTNNVAFNWTTPNGSITQGQGSPSPQVNKPGQYLIVVTDLTNGCSATDSTIVTEIPDPSFTASADQPTCLTPRGTLRINQISNGQPPFTYSADGGQTYQNSLSFPTRPPGTYQLVVLDANGCSSEKTLELLPPVFPTVQLDNILTLVLGDSIQLEPQTNINWSDISSWTWTTDSTLSCLTCPEPYALPVKNQRYTLTITNTLGCTATANTEIRIIKRRFIYAPNIFTPDGDGLDDYFTLYGKGVKKIQSLAIFDRWGSQLFLSEGIDLNQDNLGWDGNYKGAPLNPAVFVWQAIVEFIDGEVEVLSGDITLKR